MREVRREKEGVKYIIGMDEDQLEQDEALIAQMLVDDFIEYLAEGAEEEDHEKEDSNTNILYNSTSPSYLSERALIHVKIENERMKRKVEILLKNSIQETITITITTKTTIQPRRMLVLPITTIIPRTITTILPRIIILRTIITILLATIT